MKRWLHKHLFVASVAALKNIILFFYTGVGQVKDFLALSLMVLVGLVVFVAYLSYAAKFSFFIALACLTCSLVKHSLIKHSNSQSLRLDEARFPVA